MAHEADPLTDVERVAFAEEVSSVMRHSIRNKIGAVRNAATYLRRRLKDTEAWTKDPRIETFSKLMETELDAANALLEPRSVLGHLAASKVERVAASACVQTAVSSARISSESMRALRVEAEPGDVNADPRELALAVRCLIENAAEAILERGTIRVRGRALETLYAVSVSDDGPGVAEGRRDEVCAAFFTTKQGHQGLGLNIARRVAHRFGGGLTLAASSEGGLEVTLTVARHREA